MSLHHWALFKVTAELVERQEGHHTTLGVDDDPLRPEPSMVSRYMRSRVTRALSDTGRRSA
jgi:hypothetical protein